MTFLPPTRRIYSLQSGWLSGCRGLSLLAHLRLPPMRFVFLGPGVVRLQLPSRCIHAMRLYSAGSSHHQGLRGDFHPPLVTSRSAFASRSSDVLTDVGAPCPAHTKKSLHQPGCRLWKRADATTAWREFPRSPGSGPPRPWRRSTCRPPSPRSGHHPLATGSAVRGRLSSFVSGYQPPDRRLACRNLKNCSIGFRSCRSSVILSVWDA